MKFIASQEIAAIRDRHVCVTPLCMYYFFKKNNEGLGGLGLFNFELNIASRL